MKKKAIYFLLFLLAMAIAYIAGIRYTFTKSYESVKADVIIEQMKEVAKMVSVEAQVSEMYNHKEYYTWDVSPFRKEALVRVNAKVMAGFDLEKMNFVIDSLNKKVLISYLPESEILSIDHDLDYYDISQGVFNKFTTEDYNKINTQVKELVKKKALESNILKRSNEQRDELFELFENMIKAMGYDLEIKRFPTPSFRG